tara:strand:- start:1938 stop:2147 length:210 start_codon:yes stop_codon:yes gene_type:complete
MTLALLLLAASASDPDLKVATSLRIRHHNGTHHHASSNASRAHAAPTAVHKTAAAAPTSKTKVMGDAAR